jgi:hypothetical protein
MSDKELELQEEEILESQDAVDAEKQLTESPKAKKYKKEEDEAEMSDDDMEDESEEEDEDEEEKSESKKAVKESAAPKTKAGMIQSLMDEVSKMKKEELAGKFGKIVSSLKDVQEEVEPVAEEVSMREVRKVTKDEIDVAEDVKAIFGAEDLSEEFTSKATTIFEAAVLSKVNEVLESVTVDFEAELESEKDSIAEDLSKKLDGYLEYVAEEWMTENKIAVEQGIRAEIMENFMTGLRNLFTENYIDIPEEKVDLVDELAAKVGELESSVNEEMERNIELRKDLAEAKKSAVLRDVCEGLTESQAVKMKSLAEGVDFDSEDDFAGKLATIKENYFGEGEGVQSLSESVDEEPLQISEETEAADPSMTPYMDAISRSIKK